ncbi:4-(cytidine 5'-diphospho)-2-C-methyl-D-erythritol kinase [Stakelama tenebrarum]|uniref:4-diphosphocytidyl-2-C-methyl-D-erythritol kinase n=1 Tax=Stakelama tenebrarum TaxID=2711215 RepID=A0A6G6Y667_9SPHN|nr:4-(cytidine 5'-diphospho)-2-C-methyl-D-erythritol kinase [Sphingosinithalassobacter tenebrarum]QIG80341.1 4-(cytidine 5'-diphospho)-2-C-methyl-D-erythritol kinase [Sphingosinithalassobacter tenebrarum]
MIAETARAKLNLALHVRARRADGYHDLETLFAFVDHGDTVNVAISETPEFSVSGPFAGALADEGDNLVTRAERAFCETFGISAGHRLHLEKHLPVASGIGGGSADAAATLRALARLHEFDLKDPRLFAIADSLGADVPACLFSVTAIGKGRGERLQPIAGAPGTPVLLVNPGVAVSTAAIFARWSGDDGGALPSGPLLDVAATSRNDLYPPARDIAPEIGGVIDWLESQPGAGLVRMSGSGATCFALFESAAACAAACKAAPPHWWGVATALV